MLVTGLLFLAVSALFVLRHLRRNSAAAAPLPAGGPCPRCGAELPAEQAVCTECGAHPQVFELVTAPVAREQDVSESSVPPHAVVRADLCVGCGTCVDGCPEEGALYLKDKVAIVDRDKCAGHGSCVQACPVAAIVLSTGAAVQTVETPDLSTDFESNVPGLYVVGELGGRGLIKNAVNEGRIAAEHAARSLSSGMPADGSVNGILDLIIVGSGPAGLSAALEAHRQGLRFLVLEQGSLADSIRKYPRKKVLFSEPINVPLYGDLWVSDGSKETLLQVWETIVEKSGLEVRSGTRVEDVARENGAFRVAAGGSDHRARKVILAMGRRGTPRRLGVPGEESDHVFYDIVEMETFRGRRMLVVGGGDSALESALGLANQPDTPVTLSYRGSDFKRIKQRNRAKLEAAVSAGRIELLLDSVVKQIEKQTVRIEVGGASRALPIDDVVVRIGGIPPTGFLQRVGVSIVRKSLSLIVPWALLCLPALGQVSPGPLSRAHAQLDSATGCLDCHRGGKKSLRDRCLDCHREIAWNVERGSGLHGRIEEPDCASCHPDHAGLDFELIDWGSGGPKSFDHRRAGWKLEGRHTSLRCADCHRAEFQRSPVTGLIRKKPQEKSWLGLQTDCLACHEDRHGGNLDTDCRRCHGIDAWKPAPLFDHAATVYPLTGGHVGVACERCHLVPGKVERAAKDGTPLPRYKPVPYAECSDCHADSHQGRLGAACAGCHVTTSFAEVNRRDFDHARTRYPLLGRHARVDCARCHDRQRGWGERPPFQRCDSCHRDAHDGTATLEGRIVDCASCHDVNGFRPSTFTVEQHRRSVYPLEGKHAAVPCADCHRDLSANATRLRPAHAACADCHRDAHDGQFARRPDGGACESCHLVEGWAPSTYDAERHARLEFGLEGRHARAACRSCHLVGEDHWLFLPLDAGCASCHLDPHANRFAAESCSNCHDAATFSPARLGTTEHMRFAFPLEGAHRTVPCVACHAELKLQPSPNTLLTAGGSIRALILTAAHDRCSACHDRIHGDQFDAGFGGGDCAACHSAAAFRPAFRFDHDRDAKFRLAGGHENLDCGKCHVAQRDPDGTERIVYRSVSTECEDCHVRRR